MISERTLRKWRKESLNNVLNPKLLQIGDGEDAIMHISGVRELNSRILQLTQELMDQHLLKQKK